MKVEPEAAVAAGAAVAAAATDPWHSGLELVAANSEGDAALAGPLTDAGLDALLAPFEDWTYLLQPASIAAPLEAAEACPDPSTQQQLTGVPALPSAAGQGAAGAQPAAALGTAANSPRHSSRGGGAACGPAATSSGTSSGAAGGKAPRRKGGRPRLHHPTATAAAAAAAGIAGAGACSAGSSAAGSQAAAIVAAAGSEAAVQLYKKSGRGPKPKYVFTTREEAADARRERNRKAALESYYRKKEHAQRLQAELEAMHTENSALERLLEQMNTTGTCPLPEASNDGINVWLQLNSGSANPASP